MGHGTDLEKRQVVRTIDTECEVDFGLGMGGEIIKRSLLPWQLAEQSRKYKAEGGHRQRDLF